MWIGNYSFQNNKLKICCLGCLLRFSLWENQKRLDRGGARVFLKPLRGEIGPFRRYFFKASSMKDDENSLIQMKKQDRFLFTKMETLCQ
jgi:hypothetical protein